MLRRIGYRAAATVFVFAGLWFVLGLLVLATPVPHALGIGSALFVAWLLLFLTVLALAGASLTMAAINGLFPPRARRTAGVAAARPASSRAPRGRRPDAPPATAATATHDADGRPLPWTQSPLPDRTPRRTTSHPRPGGQGR